MKCYSGACMHEHVVQVHSTKHASAKSEQMSAYASLFDIVIVKKSLEAANSIRPGKMNRLDDVNHDR